MKFYILLSVVIACTFIFTGCSTYQQITSEQSTSATEISTVNNDDCYTEVDNALSDLCKSDEFKNATDDEKAKLGMSILENLEAKGLIMKNSITYSILITAVLVSDIQMELRERFSLKSLTNE